VTLDKILNTSTKASQAYSTKNDDQNFFTGGNPINQTNYYDDSLIENGKVSLIFNRKMNVFRFLEQNLICQEEGQSQINSLMVY